MADLDCTVDWYSGANWDSRGDGRWGFLAVLGGLTVFGGLSLLQESAVIWELAVLG